MDLTDLFQLAENRRGRMANFSRITSIPKEEERRKGIILAGNLILYLYIASNRAYIVGKFYWRITIRSWSDRGHNTSKAIDMCLLS
jgi:hypothetical protein